MLLVKVPAADRPYYRGMGYLFGGRGLGQDDGDAIDATAIYDAGAVTNAQDIATPSSYSIPDTSAPNIVGTDLSPADLSSDIPSIAQPANTILNAAGVAVPKPGYTVTAAGAVVPASSLSGITSAIASIPSTVWLLGGAGIIAISLLGGKKKRRR